MVANPSLNSDGFGTISTWNPTQYNSDGNTVFNSSPTCSNSGDVSGCYSLSNPFPDGVIQPTGSSLGPATNLGGSLSTVLHSQHTLTTYNFNLGVEYEFPHQTILSAAYVGSRGLHMPLANVDLNVLSLQTIAQIVASLCVDTSDPACVMVPNQWAAVQPSTNANYGADMVPQWVALQPYPQFGTGNYGSGNGVIVNGYPCRRFQVQLPASEGRKAVDQPNFTTLASFTWGKLMTDRCQSAIGFHRGSRCGAPGLEEPWS